MSGESTSGPCGRCGFGSDTYPIAGGSWDGSGYCLVCYDWRREKRAAALPFLIERALNSGHGGDGAEDGQLTLADL